MMLAAVDYATLGPTIAGIVAIIGGVINIRTHLGKQDGKIAEVHVLVNQRLTDALRVGELLAAQLTNAGMSPVVDVPAQPTTKSTAELATLLEEHDTAVAVAAGSTPPVTPTPATVTPTPATVPPAADPPVVPATGPPPPTA
jgi:hypothetical protein